MILFIGASALVLLAACSDPEKKGTPEAAEKKEDNAPTVHSLSLSSDPVFIVKDSANKMVSSYLESIDGDDSALRSLIVDVDSLRRYFSDTSIRQLKIMFAHTLAYINEGNGGKPAGYQSGALTIVMGGVNRLGNYVYSNTNMVPDRGAPCPHNCFVTGTAASDLFQ